MLANLLLCLSNVRKSHLCSPGHGIYSSLRKIGAFCKNIGIDGNYIIRD